MTHAHRKWRFIIEKRTYPWKKKAITSFVGYWIDYRRTIACHIEYVCYVKIGESVGRRTIWNDQSVFVLCLAYRGRCTHLFPANPFMQPVRILLGLNIECMFSEFYFSVVGKIGKVKCAVWGFFFVKEIKLETFEASHFQSFGIREFFELISNILPSSIQVF